MQIIILLAFTACFFLVDRGIYYVFLYAYQRIPRAESGGMVPEALEIRADLVVLGSSRARHHYVPAILEDRLGVSVYNLGADGQGIAFMRCAIDILLGKYRPKFLIFDIAPSLLSVEKHALTMPRVTTLAAYLDESAAVRELVYGKGPFEKIKYFSRAFRFNDMPVRYIFNGLFPRKELASLKGFSPLMRTLTPKTEHKAPADLVLDHRATDLLRAAVIQAKMRGVRVILVQSPHWPSKGTSGQPQYQLIAAAQKIAESEQVPFIRITPQTDTQFKDHGLYADESHLNYEGAKLFSTILAERLLDEQIITNKQDSLHSSPGL